MLSGSTANGLWSLIREEISSPPGCPRDTRLESFSAVSNSQEQGDLQRGRTGGYQYSNTKVICSWISRERVYWSTWRRTCGMLPQYFEINCGTGQRSEHKIQYLGDLKYTRDEFFDVRFMMEWSKDISFDWNVVDEATVMTEVQCIAVTRRSPITIWMGDQQQLGTTIISKPIQNPFCEQLRFSPFVRFIENGHSFHLLREVMRMGSGLDYISSEIFYNGKLIPGETTDLNHPTRETGRKLQEVIRSRYPTLQHEPKGLFYPFAINITAESVSSSYLQTLSHQQVTRISGYSIALQKRRPIAPLEATRQEESRESSLEL